jgi:hypothetical protein
MRTKLFTIFAVTILASLSMGLMSGADNNAAPALAPVQDTLSVNYFTNANTDGAPDGTVELTNPGTSGGYVCANIYVFLPDEEMNECCSCALSPDGLRTLSINGDLTSNPLIGIKAINGLIKIVSSASTGTTCGNGTTITPTPSVRAWGTHILGLSTGGYTITEEEFQSANLGNKEISSLIAGCNAIHAVGSGSGLCTCGSGE